MDSNMGDVNVPRKVRINGGLMGNYLNEHVILKGFFNMIDSTGKCGTIKTTDDQLVQVDFDPPLHASLEQGSLIEIIGKVVDSTKIQASEYSHFTPDVADTFDCEMYNNAIKVMISHNEYLVVDVPPDETIDTVITNLNDDLEFFLSDLNPDSESNLEENTNFIEDF
ncbi:hypothetical protein RDWZM_004506 [Blomia tropicalis]|uniref:Replication factor A protein 3 n=1 Tax=Blomia tropicalis TaxID=40697 RepID=A0A9Q0RLF0_BLOTA|nr:hypothetical protein RDWZM_004506 [Blomia tropicalis]